MKDELRSQEELSVAAMGYIPPFWLFLLLFSRWRKNYYTRYHLVHAALVSLALFLVLMTTVVLTFLSSSWTGYSFFLMLLTGGLIGSSLLISFGSMLYFAFNAYRGRYTVMPVLTRIYYFLFSQRAIRSDNPYDSRRITHMRPYLKQERD